MPRGCCPLTGWPPAWTALPQRIAARAISDLQDTPRAAEPDRGCGRHRDALGRAFSRNETLWNNVASRHPSGFAPENLITLAHFSVSSAMSLPKSAGEPANTVPPRSAIRALIRGSVRATLICLLSLSMISVGVFLGAATPNQPLAS